MTRPKHTNTITVRVKPNAARDEVLGTRDGALEVRVAAPPAEGAANARLQRVLAEYYGVAPSSVHLVAGRNSRLKRVAINNK